MTRKIRYKEASPQLERMASPNFESSSRASVGMEKFVGEYFFLDVEKLIPFRNQARKIFDQEEIEQLARTIKEHGIRQPLTVSKSDVKEGSFEVISGERRLRAAKIVGLTKVPCIIIQDSAMVDEIAIIENIQRTDLHPIELGQALHKILVNAPHGKQIEVGEKLGMKKSYISEVLKFAELPQEISKIILEKNLRSRELLRRFVNADGLESMKRILSDVVPTLKLDQNLVNQPVKSQSILRISFSDKGFAVQKSKISFLSNLEKNELKKVLSALIKEI